MQIIEWNYNHHHHQASILNIFKRWIRLHYKRKTTKYKVPFSSQRICIFLNCFILFLLVIWYKKKHKHTPHTSNKATLDISWNNFHFNCDRLTKITGSFCNKNKKLPYWIQNGYIKIILHLIARLLYCITKK